MAGIVKLIEKHKMLVISGTVLFGAWLYTNRHHFGFADKDPAKKKPQSQHPSDSDIDSLIKQHHIGNPNKDMYDIDYPTTGKHKGDIGITDLGPYTSSTPTPTHRRHPQGSIYPSSAPSNADCCAQLQMLMSQGGGYVNPWASDPFFPLPEIGGGHMPPGSSEGWGFDDW